jgi:transcriptional regulator with XRE-family HTH domain
MTALKITKRALKENKMTVGELIAVHTELVGITNIDLAAKLGYKSPNVISMLKAGTMKLPVNKIAALASALRIDPLHLAKQVCNENGFQLDGVLDALTKRVAITHNEEKLILALRGASENFDLNLDDHPETMKAIVGAYTQVTAGERATEEEILRQLKTKKRSAVAQNDKVQDDVAVE